MATIDTALVARLRAHAGLAALVGTRIYAAPVPQNATYPLCTVQEIDRISPHAMGCTIDLTHIRYQIDSWASTLAESKAVAAQVEAALDNYAGTSDTIVIKNCFLDMGHASPYNDEEGVFRYIQDFLLEYER
jgi:hypothetical protein